MKSHQPAKFVISEKVSEFKCNYIYIAVVIDVKYYFISRACSCQI